MNILITGGAGFIGSYVAEEIVKRGHKVLCADRSLLNRVNGCEYQELDVTNKKRVYDLINEFKPNLTIHLAGILGTSETWNHVTETVDSNIVGAINVYDAAASVKSDILTVDVGSRWLVPYTISKRCAAEFAFAYGNKYKIKAGVLRIFNVYGPRQGTKIIKIVPKFIEQALKNGTLEVWGNKNADLIHAKDVATAFANAADNMSAVDQVQDLLIGSGKILTVKDVASSICKKIGRGNIKDLAPRVGEEKIDAGYQESNKANQILNWNPVVDWDQGLDETIAYYRTVFGY